MSKWKKALRQQQSTRALMGIRRITDHGVATASGERVFYLIRPDNLSVLSPDGMRLRVAALTNLLRANPILELLALDSRESFQSNQMFYRARLEEEPVPEIRALLQKDLEHLDAIQSSSASSREFVLVLPVEGQAVEDGSLRQMEKALCDHGVPVRLAEREDVKRLLAVYYQQGSPVEGWEAVDGERAVSRDG